MSEIKQTTERVRLSQWDAIVLESVRALGLDSEELLRRAAEGELPSADNSIIADFTPLLILHREQPEVLEQAVKQGYRIKYNTLGGINTWIKIVFGRDSEVERGEGIEGVAVELTAAERERLAPVLSIGWTIERQGEGKPAEVSQNAGNESFVGENNVGVGEPTFSYRVVPVRA
ncbi:hypothetical protein [Saccharibacillus sacchari]|uniref:Uncharacterized protein n=1 Tax=Saccharibacillus sacchari TaxID=456493 RepID=A0ACC6PHP2_9BACL